MQTACEYERITLIFHSA